MKKLIIALLLGSSLMACNSAETEKNESPKNETYTKNLATMKSAIAAFSARDSTKFASYIADNFTWSPPSFGNDSVPRAQYLAALNGYMRTYNDITFTKARFFPGMDTTGKFDGSVRVYGVWKSKFAKSGKTNMLKYYATSDFDSTGKIVRTMEYYNVADLAVER